METIPEKNEKIYLRSKSNITSGGDSIDVTDEFPDEIKKVAVDALKAIPNFPNGGVDIMVDPNKSTLDSAKVIELTPVPQIGSLVFPMTGKARDIPSAIIDEYFPETRELSNNNPNIYFYLPDILRPLVNKTASEVKVIPCPTNIELQKKVIVTGSFGQNKTLRAVRKLALENNLHGYVQKIKTNQVEIGIAGTNDDISTFISLLKKISPIDDLLDKEWDAPIKVGFEIKKSILDKEVVANNKQTHRKKGIFVRLFNKLS